MVVLVLSAAVVLVGLGLLPGPGLTTGPACTVTSPTGEPIAAGSSDVVAELVSQAPDEIAVALAAGPAVICRITPIAATDVPKELPRGLTPQAAQLRREVRAVFGRIPDGGYGPEETLPGRSPNGEHSLGRAIDFFFRPYTDPEQGEAGWQLANWAVANAERLGIRTVIYRDRIWTARRSGQGWREYRFRGRDADNPINRHLDHVHIDVA